MKKLFSVIAIISMIFSFIAPINSAAQEINSTRISGKDRFEVAVNTSKIGWPNGSSTVIISSHKAFADALAASPYALKVNAPILLTDPNKLTTVTKTEINRLKPTKVIIVGGSLSVSDAIIKELKTLGITSFERIGGKDRFEVSYNIALKMGGTGTAVIANGLNFPDALSIAPYAAKNGFPILLTESHKLPAKTNEAIKKLGIKNTIISGGVLSVGEQVKASLPAPVRINGKDRYEVSANIVKQLAPSTTKVFIATGLTFADALTGSVLAAKQNASILLTHPTTIAPSVRDLIKTKNLSNFVILGGPVSVPDKTFQILTGQIPETPPLPLSGKVVVLDPGHGGTDPGAVKNGYKEVDLNNKFTTKLANKLTAMGAKVTFTRNPGQNIYLSLPQRAVIANNANAHLFISIHHDSNLSSTPRGLSAHYSSYRPAIETKDVYVLSGGKKYPFIREDTVNKKFIVQNGSSTLALDYNNSPNIAYDPTPSPSAQKSNVLASGLAKALVYPGAIGISQVYSSTGVKDHNLYVTRWTKMPSVLVELGFISNPQEVKFLADETIQQKRATAAAEEIKKFLIQ